LSAWSLTSDGVGVAGSEACPIGQNQAPVAYSTNSRGRHVPARLVDLDAVGGSNFTRNPASAAVSPARDTRDT
jgi:hypothetical protein